MQQFLITMATFLSCQVKRHRVDLIGLVQQRRPSGSPISLSPPLDYLSIPKQVLKLSNAIGVHDFCLNISVRPASFLFASKSNTANFRAQKNAGARTLEPTFHHSGIILRTSQNGALRVRDHGLADLSYQVVSRHSTQISKTDKAGT